MNKIQLKAYEIFIICISILIIGTTIYIYYPEQTNLNYCEIYAEQKVTASRIGYGGEERQYSLNGTWVNESILFEDCKTFINI